MFQRYFTIIFAKNKRAKREYMLWNIWFENVIITSRPIIQMLKRTSKKSKIVDSILIEESVQNVVKPILNNCWQLYNIDVIITAALYLQFLDSQFIHIFTQVLR